MKRAVSGVILAIALPLAALAQAPSFEQADMERSAPGTREGCGFLPEGRFECRGATMLRLIAMAYNRNPDTIAGGPDWLASDRFDVVAKAASRKASPEAMRPMLETLLADRFGLVVHNDQRDLPVYVLSVSKHGLKLRQTANSNPPACPAADGEPGLIHRACSAFRMTDLIELLPKVAKQYVDRPVIDATGLQGAYDFELDWMSKSVYLAAKAKGGSGAVSVFDALGKLGLDLKPGTRPAAALVIDRVDRTPKENEHAATPAEFDVAEVRPSQGAQRQALTVLPSGQIEILGYTLRELITLAFELTDDRVAGGPKWVDSDRFDVIAKSPSAMSPHAVSAMLKTLIVRRFQLETHTEDRPVTVLALVSVKRSPKFKPAAAGARSECKLTLAEKGRAYICHSTTMSQLVDRLPNVAQAYFTHPFLDFTGLEGAYDFSLTWTPKARLPVAVPQAADAPPQASIPAGDLTVFEAIEKQLGLKVEERKHPMPVTVIDRVGAAGAGN